jgi:hypothetical protein
MNAIFLRMLSFILLLFTAVTHAGTMGSTTGACLDQGLYVGGNIGLLNLNDHESTSSPYASHQLGATGINGGGLVGYNFSMNEQLKIGTEWFMNAVGNSVAAEESYSPFASYTAKMRYEVGLRVLPRYALSPCTFAHLILGYSNGSFVINDNGDFGLINKNLSQNGFQTGLGVMTSIWSYIPLFLRADLLYTTYASNTANGTNSQGQQQTYKNNFSTIAGNLALIYQFS